MMNINKKVIVALIMAVVVMFNMSIVSYAAETTVGLGTASNFAVLAGSTITNTGTTVIDGNVGLHPGTAFIGQETVTVNGSIHIADAVAELAKSDLLSAYNDAAGRAVNTVGAELGGGTLIPGVYSAATSMQITGTLTLDAQNDSNAVFIFQAGSTLTTASASKVVLINGASASNVFWQVGSSATLGTNSEFVGNILASESITATTGARIQGKLLALGGAVTLDNNTIFTGVSSSLTVSKTVTGDTDALTLPTFEITVTGPNNFTETRTFAHGESYTWDNLVTGDYNVLESRVGLGSEWTVSGEGTIAVGANSSQSVSIVNAYLISEEVIPVETTPIETTPIEVTPIETTPIVVTPIDITPIDVTPIDSVPVGVLPQTGQKTNYGMAMIFGSLAIVVASAGVLIGLKKNRFNE